jgi:hypothetical protein
MHGFATTVLAEFAPVTDYGGAIGQVARSYQTVNNNSTLYRDRHTGNQDTVT